MTLHATNPRRGDGLTPTAPELLRSPLDFIAEDHLRVRTMCVKIDALVQGAEPPEDDLWGAVEFLSRELPMLLGDEDTDLLPMVAERSAPEDDMPKLKARLEAEHADIGELSQTVVSALKSAADGRTPLSAAEVETIGAFTALTRRHIALENAVLLPLARARLTGTDLERLRDNMLRRRGLSNA